MESTLSVYYEYTKHENTKITNIIHLPTQLHNLSIHGVNKRILIHLCIIMIVSDLYFSKLFPSTNF